MSTRGPRYTTTVSVPMRDDVVTELDERAMARGMTRTEALREATQAWLAVCATPDREATQAWLAVCATPNPDPDPDADDDVVELALLTLRDKGQSDAAKQGAACLLRDEFRFGLLSRIEERIVGVALSEYYEAHSGPKPCDQNCPAHSSLPLG